MTPAKQSDDEAQQAPATGVEKLAVAGVHLAAIILQVAAVALVVNAVYRYTVGGGFGVITEVTRFALLVVVFLGLAGTHLVSGHVQVEIALASLPQRFRDMLEGYVIPVMSGLYLAFLGWAGWVATVQMFQSGTTTPSRPAILMWPFAAVVPLGCGLLIVILLVQVFRRVTRRRASGVN
ncbi:TRAP transporter small permease [Devosia sp.]|uniref:TRAP transporter small permease n=1 Tax=Devosia sp. TaxID=1871048 RepID=UPI0027322D7A|nr:TRAP transporter small permease [Devosia sp.]MDP2780073.1 TRAP transporter small permease [Devosia sp.]